MKKIVWRHSHRFTALNKINKILIIKCLFSKHAVKCNSLLKENFVILLVLLLWTKANKSWIFKELHHIVMNFLSSSWLYFYSSHSNKSVSLLEYISLKRHLRKVPGGAISVVLCLPPIPLNCIHNMHLFKDMFTHDPEEKNPVKRRIWSTFLLLASISL